MMTHNDSFNHERTHNLLQSIEDILKSPEFSFEYPNLIERSREYVDEITDSSKGRTLHYTV